MRGVRAKQLRKFIYGDKPIRNTRYVVIQVPKKKPTGIMIRCVGERAEYQALKKAIRRRV